jgi:hypothetical protein
MAKRKGKPTRKRAPKARKQAARRAGTRLAKRSAAKRPAAKRPARKPARRPRPLTETDVIPTPPSSLNLNRHGSAARSGRAELAAERSRRRNLSPELAGGDVDADLESAYFTGEEAAGGDNPTPDQDVVDDIGRAVGVEFQDNEELDADKVAERDKHRWELDPASSEDYKDRD